MGDGGAACHHISIDLLFALARKLEHAIRAFKQRIEALARGGVGKARAIIGAVEWQYDLQFPTELERDFRRDLVSPVRNRRHKVKLRRQWSEAALLSKEQRLSRIRDQQQHVADLVPQAFDAAVGDAFGPMSGDPHGQHKRQVRRPIGGRIRIGRPGFQNSLDVH
jgi:hypothetical protein